MAVTGGVGIGAPGRPPRPTGGVGIPNPPSGIVRGGRPGGIIRGGGSQGGLIRGGGHGTVIGAPPKASPTQVQGAEASNPGGNDNLDATYFANTNTNTFNVNNKVNALTEQGAQNEVALQSALSQLAYQQPRDQLAAMQAENSRGGLYSSVEGQQQGDIADNYYTRGHTMTTNNQAASDAIAKEIAALQGGIPLYEKSQALASSERLAAKAAANPALAAPPDTGGGGIVRGGGTTATSGPAAGLTKGQGPPLQDRQGGIIRGGKQSGSFASSPAAQALARALAANPTGKKRTISRPPGGKPKSRSGGAGI